MMSDCPYCGGPCQKVHHICGRCYDDVETLTPANCKEKPELLVNVPLGMYHCPECGAMLLAGFTHPELCILCTERRHPMFD